MNRHLRTTDIIKDDKAQALTEFAITIPVVLLFFLAMIQYVVVVRAEQLCNYAAYAAARCYAVHAKDPTANPQGLATQAAALALAPVARVAPGELFGAGASPSSDLSDFPGKHLAEILEGWGTALFRLQNVGSITFTPGGSPDQINVQINYPQPIYIPGLSQLWALTGGEKGLHRSLSPAGSGLGTGLEGLLATAQGLEAIQDAQFQNTRTYTPVTQPVLPYVNLQARCSMGVENWGRAGDSDRPRMPKDGEPTDSPVPGLDQRLQAMQNAQNAVNDASKNVNDKAAAVVDAQKKVQAAQDAVNAAQTQFDNAQPGPDKNAALAKLNAAKAQLTQAQGELAQAQSEYDQAKSDYQNKQNDLNNLANSPWP